MGQVHSEGADGRWRWLPIDGAGQPQPLSGNQSDQNSRASQPGQNGNNTGPRILTDVPPARIRSVAQPAGYYPRRSSIRQSLLVAMQHETRPGNEAVMPDVEPSPLEAPAVDDTEMADAPPSTEDKIDEMENFEEIVKSRDADRHPRQRSPAPRNAEEQPRSPAGSGIRDIFTDELLLSSPETEDTEIVIDVAGPAIPQKQKAQRSDWSSTSSESTPPVSPEPWPPKRAPCKHRCKNKKKCDHKCCKRGLAYPPHVRTDSQLEIVRRMQEPNGFAWAQAHRREVGELLGALPDGTAIILGTPSPPRLRLRMNRALANQRFSIRRPPWRRSDGSRGVTLKLGTEGRKKHFSA